MNAIIIMITYFKIDTLLGFVLVKSRLEGNEGVSGHLIWDLTPKVLGI